MPKKGKGKKGKGKKGKKGKKNENSPLKMAARNEKLWENRLNGLDQSRLQYREAVVTLNNENDTLRDQMRQTEKDTIDVISYLKKQDAEKDAEIERLETEIETLLTDNQKDQEELIADFDRQRRQIQDRLTKKENELEVVRHELNQVKEFRKKKAQMQQELDEIKEAMLWHERDHKESLERFEQKFIAEKQRLQQETNEKIQEIATKAQDEALKGLDENTRNIYKENVDLHESIRIFKRELDQLEKSKEQLMKQLMSIGNDRQMNDALMKEKVEQVQQNRLLIKEHQEKIQSLEKSLKKFIDEFQIERDRLIEQSQIERQSSVNEIEKLQRALELKTREISKVKKLGKTILEQRTDLESMFLDALETVKKRILLNRVQQRKETMQAYKNRIVSNAPGSESTALRAFNETLQEVTANSIFFRDLEENHRASDSTADIDVTDLTWEQKENVLKELFIRMNTRVSSMTDSTSNAAHLTNDGHPVERPNDSAMNVFLTQTGYSTQNDGSSIHSSRQPTPSAIPKLPKILTN